MSYGLNRSGVTNDTYKNLMLGAGTIYKNLHYNSTSNKWVGEPLGATSGGSVFKIVPEILNIEVDGTGVKIKGLTQKVGETATMEINMIEFSSEIMRRHIIGEEIEGVGDFKCITTKATIDNGDYLDNIAYVGFLSTNEPIIIIMENALCTEGMDVTGENKKNSVFKAIFECHSGLEENELNSTLPVYIYYPNSVNDGTTLNIYTNPTEVSDYYRLDFVPNKEDSNYYFYKVGNGLIVPAVGTILDTSTYNPYLDNESIQITSNNDLVVTELDAKKKVIRVGKITRLGALNVTSEASSTDTGKTSITVTETLGQGNTRLYKTGNNLVMPVSIKDVALSEYMTWNGSDDITANTGDKLIIIEVSSENTVLKTGICTVTSKE